MPLTSWLTALCSSEAAEIWRSTVSERVALRLIRAANCASARLPASAAMSMPLPPPSADTIELVAEVVVMRLRTASRGTN